MERCVICDDVITEDVVKNPQAGSYEKVNHVALRWDNCGEYRGVFKRFSDTKATGISVTWHRQPCYKQFINERNLQVKRNRSCQENNYRKATVMFIQRAVRSHD